jgi:polyphosphate kinase 2
MALNPKLKPGDRIVCYYMEGDTISVPIGTTGTVKKIVQVPFGLGIQYSVNWDNGSTLDLIPDSDAWDFEDENVLAESIEKLKQTLVIDELNPNDFEEEISKLKDDDVTDEFLRNLDRKLLKSGDKVKNVKDYINKYIDSLKIRTDLISNDDDDDEYFDEDFFMYSGIEPQKSKIKKKTFVKELRPMQVELLKLQEYVKNSGKPFVVVFEGRDSAGKGTVIKALTEYLDPKYFKVVALGIPTADEKKNWFERYEREMEPNKMIFFDRSWYNRGIVEPVMGYSSYNEYIEFMANVPVFERKIVSSGIPLFKFWFSITPETQKKRFELRQASPLKYWKYSPNDAKSIDKWEDYTKYKKRAILRTKEVSPWYVIDTNDKRVGILNALRVILKNTDYPDKNEKNIGMTFPEIVTTVKEGVFEELTLNKKELLLKEVKNLDKYFSKDSLYSNIEVGEWDVIKNFLNDLRESGIVNMFSSSQYIYAPWEWIKDQTKWIDLSEKQEDAIERMKSSHEMARNTLINITLRSLGDKEFDINQVNRTIQKLANMVVSELFENW